MKPLIAIVLTCLIPIAPMAQALSIQCPQPKQIETGKEVCIHPSNIRGACSEWGVAYSASGSPLTGEGKSEPGKLVSMSLTERGGGDHFFYCWYENGNLSGKLNGTCEPVGSRQPPREVTCKE